MESVIRKDVVEIGVKSNDMLDSLKKINDDINKIKKSFGILDDSDPLDNTKEQSDKAKESIEKTKKQADKLKESLEKVGKTSFNGVISGLKKVGTAAVSATKAAAKVTVAGVGAATAGVTALVKSSVDAYSDYEQLKGGVETLFGAGGAESLQDYAESVKKPASEVQDEYNKLISAQDAVFKYANDAYKTAGLSANEYMETVTSFSASLIKSVGGDTEVAAAQANKAMVDMSDNANKMGTDMESIMNAYQGFAKQNYTMLDNLKLGYGGTPGEMKRLLADAGAIAGTTFDISSYNDIIEAIHIIQEDLGIAGTTREEATTTIQGSFNALKATWGNLMTSLVVGGDSFDQCIDNLIDSAKTFGKNIMPAIRKGIEGAGKLITTLAPYIEAELPGLVEQLLPPLLTAATSLIKGVIKALPGIMSTLIKELPNIVKQIGLAITEAFGVSMPSLGKFGNAFIENANVIAKIIPYLLGGVAAFKAIGPIVSGFNKISGIFGKSDKYVKKMTNPLESIAKANTKTILKGMGNIAIIVGGVTILAAAIMLVAPYIAKLTDVGSLIKVIGTITVLGIVGTALASMASIVGKIPIMTVVKGLANMAIMLAGMTAVYTVIGLITSKFSFDYNKMLGIAKMIGVLGTIGAVTAVFAGVAGLIPIPIVLAGLANIALILGGLTAVVVAFGELSTIPGINDFISNGGALLSNLFNQLGNIVGSLLGGLGEGITNSLPIIGNNLTSFVESIKPIFTMGEGANLKDIGSFFASIGSFMLQMAGNDIASFFTGGTDFEELGGKLDTFAESSKGFFDKVKDFPEEGFPKAKSLFQSLADIGNIPNVGGWVQKIGGTNDYSGVADGLKTLSGEGVIGFFTKVADIPQESFESAKTFFEVMSGISNLPNSGGFLQSFTGENDIKSVGEGLNQFATDTEVFFTQVNGLNIEKLDGLWNSLKNAGSITVENISQMVDDNIDNVVNKVSELPKKMGDAIINSGSSLSVALVKIWKDAVNASATPVNKLIDGANWILTQFGSSKRVVKWTPYAKGTDGHNGGNALVNDGRGAELVQMPNGNTFIPKGKNIFIPNAPKGMKVLNAEDTANVMGKSSPTFRYKDGNIDIWSFIDNAAGLVTAVKDKFVSYNAAGIISHIGKGLVSIVGDAMVPWTKKLYDEFGALSLANYNPSAGVNQWKSTVIRALQMEGQYNEANVARTLYQMQTESGGNPYAINDWDSNAKKGTPSKGLMQVIDPTFATYARPGFNSNIYDPLSNILASIRYAMARYGSLARAYQGHGYANGGIATKPSIFGEDGAEMAIPLSDDKRKRALELWTQTGKILGIRLSEYTPENAPASNVNNSVVNDNYNFNLSINVEGGSSDRTTARNVKNAVKDGIKEMMNSFANGNKPVREY